MSKLPKTHDDWTSLRNREIQKEYTVIQKENREIHKEYTVIVRNRFNELCSENNNVIEIYSHFVEANEHLLRKSYQLKRGKY